MAARKTKRRPPPSPERRAAALAKLSPSALEARIRAAEAGTWRLQRALIKSVAGRGDLRVLLLVLAEMEAQTTRTLKFVRTVMQEVLA